MVEGKIASIDHSVQNGIVTVDAIITDVLPRGLRPDLSVDGTIGLERLDVLFSSAALRLVRNGAQVGTSNLTRRDIAPRARP